jgi:hypothetical protein
MTFRFSVGAIDAGQARMFVGRPVRSGARRVLAIDGTAQSARWLALIAKLDDSYRVELDADSLAPRKVRCVERGLRDRTFDMTLSALGPATRVELVMDRPGAATQREARTFPGQLLDPVAALFTIRAAPLRDGDRFVLATFDGPALYRSTVNVIRREKLEGRGEPLPVVRVEVDAERVDALGRPAKQPVRHVTLWLSDDVRRVPYRISGDTDFGRCDLDLTGYREGR